MKLFIEGMKCMNCERHVREALLEVAGVSTVNINLEGKYAMVDGNNLSVDQLKNVIQEAGYEVVGVE